MKIKIGFTLAEVLITLGIIGVVAAMTIPNLMTAFAKHRVETQLVKFYSTMNQAIRMSVADNGTPEGWVVSGKTYTYDENVEFLETYISPYLKHSDYKSCADSYYGSKNSKYVCIDLFSGGASHFFVDSNGLSLGYYIDGDATNKTPRNFFSFQMSRAVSISDRSLNSTNYLEPYIYEWDGTTEGLKKGTYGCYKKCSYCNYCTKWIQLNSWKIPSDYPLF